MTVGYEICDVSMTASCLSDSRFGHSHPDLLKHGGLGIKPAWNDTELSFDRQTIEELEPAMQDIRPDETSDPARVSAWMEEIGGSVFVGQGKLKSVKISKSGNKLTLVVKKKKKIKAKKQNKPEV